MHHRTSRIAAAALSLLLIAAFGATGQEKGQDPAAQKAAMDEMMKTMMKLALPGEPHKKLADLAGAWDATVTMTMGPGAAPSTSKGSVVQKAVLGGRFLASEMKGEMMGMPMEGVGYMGYDNYNKKYTMFWVDNMGTAMATAEGSADQSGKVITLYGKMDEPTTGEHDKNVKYVYRLQDKDKYTFEIHDLAIGEPNTKVIEVVYTRKK
ncbi:MAG: DUF1579 domain-containing protein [Bacteroidota bacterium]